MKRPAFGVSVAVIAFGLVGCGTPRAAVPDVTGLMSATAAIQHLKDAGFSNVKVVPETSTVAPLNAVFAQSPQANATVPKGATITLTVSLGPPAPGDPGSAADIGPLWGPGPQQRMLTGQ